jgi:hypothetical protein
MSGKPGQSKEQLILASLLSLICQVILAAVVHDAIVGYYTSHYAIMHRDVAWGITVRSLGYYFVVVAFCHNMLTVYFQKRAWVISTAASVVFFLIVLPYYSYHPLRSLNVILVGGLSIWAKYMFEYIYCFIQKRQAKERNG